MSRRLLNLALVLPLCALPLACTGGDEPSLDNTNFDDATCAPQANQAFDECGQSCDASFGNDDECEDAAANDFKDKLGTIWIEMISLPDPPDFIQDAIDCVSAIDAQGDCGAVGADLSQHLDELGDRYGFDPGLVSNIVGTIAGGTCNFARTIDKATCIMRAAGADASDFAKLSADLGSRIANLGWDFVSMLASEGGCFAQNVANDVQRTACVGADLGPASVGCYGTKYSAYWSCRGTCPAAQGSACVPPGVPGWVDCGHWDSDITTGGCECIGDAIRAPVCRTFAWDTTWDRSNGAPCELTVDGQQVRARNYFIVDKDANGAPVGGSIRCVAVDDFDMPCTMPGQQQGCPASVDQ